MQMLARNGVEALFAPPPTPTSQTSLARSPFGGATAVGDKAGGLASQAGLIPRLVRGLFEAVASAGADVGFTMSCQLIEIYNEGLRDLLQRGMDAQSRRTSRGFRDSISGPLSVGSTFPDGGVARAPGDGLAGLAEEAHGTPQDGLGEDRSVFDDDDETDAAGSVAASAVGDDARGFDTTGRTAGAGSVAAERPPSSRLLRSVVSSGRISGRDTPGGSDSNALQIREDPERGVFVAGAAQLPVTASEHVFEALAIGATQRATASTKMNERSSRSHSIFQLYITQKRLDSMTTVRSTLTIVDLAGEQREGREDG